LKSGRTLERSLSRAMKKIIVAVAVIIVAGLAAYFLINSGSPVQTYRFDKVSKGNIVASVTATGTVNAVTTVLVGTQVSGTIRTLYVDYNSPVKKGQLIAQIDPTLFQASVDQAKANLISAQANLEKAETALVDAKRTYERNKELFARNLIARSDLDTSETTYESDKALVSAAKAAINQTQAALKSAQTNLDYTRIVSPVDGIVVSRSVDVGQTVAASFQTPTLFTIAQDLTKMQIDSSVVEADIGRVTVGQTVEFTVDAYPDITFKGTVVQVRKAPIIVQNVVTYDVVVGVNNQDLKLMPGMTANVSIIISGKKDVLRIPNAALRFRPEGYKPKGEQKGVGVWVVENNNPKRVKITTGITDGNFTELTSGDLKEGQELVVEMISKAKKQSGPTGPRFF
jgi:HlyD family secretion protein